MLYEAEAFIVANEGDSQQIRTVLNKAIADSRQGVVLHVGGWARGLTILTVTNEHLRKYYTAPRKWMDPLVLYMGRELGI
jgi:hypothetical protein